MSQDFRIGIDTFGDMTASPTGELLPAGQVLRNLVELGEHVEQVGLDAFGLGEHHREDFAVSAPEIVLATLAGRTQRITLHTAVTVLSSADPVRVYEQFATLAGLSHGRAELVLGRGSFIESFPLFGYDVADYNELFDEKLALFALLQREGPVTWQGEHRSSLTQQHVYPKTETGRVLSWIGVGGTPQSVVRTAQYQMGLMLGIIGGEVGRFSPFAELFRRTSAQLHPEESVPPIGWHSPGYVAETDKSARDQFWPHYEKQMRIIGRERGWGPPSRAAFEAQCGPEGALFVGSPESVAQKVIHAAQTLGAQQFQLKVGSGTLSHEQQMRCVELLGQEVAPAVRRELTQSS